MNLIERVYSMSRTDKDAPWWLADEYYERHHFRCHNSHYLGTKWHTCDLPNNPGRPHHTKCRWFPTFAGVRTNSYWKWALGKGSPPRWFNRHVWYGPQRRQERTILGEAKKDYNANGDTDIEMANVNHRHNGYWLWW